MNRGLAARPAIVHRRWISGGITSNPAMPIYVILAVIFVVSSILSPTFRTAYNFRNLLVQAVALVIVACAQTFAILAGDVDLAVGGVISLATVIAARFMVDSGGSMLGWSLLILLLGAVIGAVNGVLVYRVRVEAMVITLATNGALMGLALAVLPYPGGSIPYRFMQAVTGEIRGVSIPVVGAALIAVGSWWVLNRSRLGVHIRAVGADPETAFRAGIGVERTKVAAHAIAGLLAAVSGLFLAARFASGDAASGVPFSLDSMTAVIAGGATFASGVGEVWGSVAGACLIVVLGNVFNHLGVSTYYQYLLKGVLLVIAVAGGALRRKWLEMK